MFKNDTDKFDQHFLIDANIINKYIELCNFNKNDVVLEIGPGKGTLTKIIAPLVKKMYAIEIDERLREFLDVIDNVDVIYNNVLNIEFPKVDKIITSLPYSIIEPFIKKCINIDFKEMYMLMGSNYVNKSIEKMPNKLSIITNSYFRIEKLIDVDPKYFDYPPRVMSSIVKITKVKKENLDIKYRIYNEIIYRDNKKIKNALEEAFISIYNITKRESKKIIVNLNIPNDILDAKFEIISNDDLVILDEILEKYKENMEK